LLLQRERALLYGTAKSEAASMHTRQSGWLLRVRSRRQEPRPR